MCLHDDGMRLVRITSSKYTRSPSMVDAAKQYVEKRLGGAIDWWPLIGGLCVRGIDHVYQVKPGFPGRYVILALNFSHSDKVLLDGLGFSPCKILAIRERTLYGSPFRLPETNISESGQTKTCTLIFQVTLLQTTDLNAYLYRMLPSPAHSLRLCRLARASLDSSHQGCQAAARGCAQRREQTTIVLSLTR